MAMPSQEVRRQRWMPFFSYSSRVTKSQLLYDFAMGNSNYVGISTSGTSYWLRCDLGNGKEWRVLLEDLAPSHPMHAITYSQIWENDVMSEEFSDTGSVWEYALTYPGIVGQIGNAHGSDTQTSITFTIDGNIITPTVNLQSGSELVVTRVSTLDNAGTPIGTVTTTYTLTNTGLKLNVGVVWVSPPVTRPSALVGMLPVTERFDKGFLVGRDLAYNLAHSVSGNLSSDHVTTDTALLWESSGTWGICKFHDSAVDTFIQDRPSINKIYPNEQPVYSGNSQFFSKLEYRVANLSASKWMYNKLTVVNTA